MTENALEREANDRLADARRQKSDIEIDIREAYFFLAPQRAREVSSQAAPSTGRRKDGSVLQTSLGMEVGQDFATEIMNAMIPQSIPWAQQRAGADIDKQDWERVKTDVAEQDDAIHTAIKASNFYPSAAQAFMPDAPVGTVAMWIDNLRPAEPVVCQPIPARELEINVGPYGEVDDRFVVRHTRYRHLAALLPGIELPREIQDKVGTKPNDRCRVTWGFWRLWDKDNDVFWQAVVLVEKILVKQTELQGAGACPIIVGRWDPDPLYAWGSGPTLKALPELRRLDEMEALKIESADFQIHPPFTYPDDGVVNFSAGIEPGMGYPARPGGGKDFTKLSFDGNVQFAEFETMRVEQRIRRLHFVDFPEQRGKTPPTAEQWMEELQRTRKRIGTPGTIFWREFPASVFLRFKWLLERAGKIAPIKVDGKTLSLAPYDPTEIAQDQQDAMIGMRLLQAAQQSFPELSQVAIDPLATLKNLKDKFRDKVVVLRTPEEMKQAAEMLQGVLGGGGGPAGAAPAAEPPA